MLLIVKQMQYLTQMEKSLQNILGSDESNVSVPTKAGYTFMGWYGYRHAVNDGSDRKHLNLVPTKTRKK